MESGHIWKEESTGFSERLVVGYGREEVVKEDYEVFDLNMRSQMLWEN